jgi:hypothetical protein
MSLKLPIFKVLIGAFCLCFIFILESCDPPTPITINEKSITEFHMKNYPVINRLNSGVNLFIDYSTCMVEAVNSSEFFNRIRPRITGMNPTLYGIRGNNIDMISSDNVSVNVELNRLREYPYANLIGACQQICDGNNQAILMTDGEYWTPGIGEMTDLPYFKDSFVKWLSRGFDIYIYVEDYNEKYHGRVYAKKRFYFIFTDDNLSNNIFEGLIRAGDFAQLSSSLKLIKLSNRDIQIRGNLTVHTDLVSTLVTDRGITAFEIGSEWEDLGKYVLYATNSVNGADTTGGDYLIRGLQMTSDPISAYSYPDLDIKVYNVSESYLDTVKPDLSSGEVRDVFILDKELYRKSGEIAIKMAEDYNNSLSEDTENLLRIDIVSRVTDKRIDETDFEWQSLSTSAINRSVYESIIQTLNDPLIDPARNNEILYTIYLKTCALK